MKIDRDHWRETVSNLYGMLHSQQDVTATELVAIIEARHAAFFGAQRVTGRLVPRHDE
jgi:hypothetical protein